MFEAVVIGDPHLDKLTKIFPNAVAMQIEAITFALDYAVNNKIANAVFLGDIAHYTSLSSEATYLFFRLLTEYEDRISIHIITGNHDYAKEKHNALKFFRMLADANRLYVKIYTEPTDLVLEGVPLVFLPHPFTSTTAKNSLVFGHFSRPGALRDNGTRMPSKAIEPDTNIYVLGHLHTHQVLNNNHFPGTLYQTNFGETPDKGFGHIKCKCVGGKLKFKYKQIPVVLPFELKTVEVGEDTVLENSDTIAYRVSTASDYAVPHDFYRKNPSVQFEYTPPNQKAITESSTTIGLKDFLKSKGLTMPQLKRAKQLLEEVTL